MHEVLRRSTARQDGDRSVRIVRVDEVASTRRSSPDCAIVALVQSMAPHDAMRAQLAGADIVVPCEDPETPDLDALDTACAAARVLAGRARLMRAETQRAAHEYGGTSSAVGLVAQLAERSTAGLRTEQLRELAARGALLAWQGGRLGRLGVSPIERIEVGAAIRGFCDARSLEDVPPSMDRTDRPAMTALLDGVRLTAALTQLVDNARHAQATTIAIDARPGDAPGFVEVVVIDDGVGLPGGWDAATAIEPFASGWAHPSDGLGLTEVAEFAADHGGHLDLDDNQGSRGATATLTLPVIEPHPVDRGGDRRLGDAQWTVSDVLEGIARRAPLTESLEALVATMEEHLPESRCSILLLGSDAASLHHGAGARLPDAYREAIDGLQIGPAVGSCGTAAFTRTEVVASDIPTDPRWAGYRDLARAHDLRSCWSTPILDVDRGVVLWTFAVYHASIWAPDSAAARLVQRLTHVAAIAIRNADLYERLVESEARFRSTFETTGLGMALIAPDGTIFQANRALEAMMDRSVDGMPLVDLLDPSDADTVSGLIDAAFSGPEDVEDDRRGFGQTEIRLRPAGSTRPLWAAFGGSVVRDQSGAARYVCAELFDLTERRRVAQARRETAMAQAASEAKSELLAHVSHELRTPLNAVIGFAQVIESMPVTPQQQREGLGHILGAGHHLLRLINDLLDLTGAESGHLQLEVVPVRTAAVVAEAMDIVASLAEERAITLAASESAPDQWLHADPQRLRQVLLNLLGNAIKFTNNGGAVSVQIDTGRVSVSDNGPGIAPEEIPNLFVPFRRHGDAQHEGSGLGLALSRRLSEAMGGALGVRSSLGTGSTFWVELPASEPAALASTAPPPQPSGPDPRGRVLYIEDDPASRQLVVAALAPWTDVEIVVVDRLEAGPSALADDPPDLLLLDVELPDGNGWDLLRRLDREGRSIPKTVMVTAGTSAHPPDLPTVDVLAKPLVVDELLRLVNRHLSSATGSG